LLQFRKRFSARHCTYFFIQGLPPLQFYLVQWLQYISQIQLNLIELFSVNLFCFLVSIWMAPIFQAGIFMSTGRWPMMDKLLKTEYCYNLSNCSDANERQILTDRHRGSIPKPLFLNPRVFNTCKSAKILGSFLFTITVFSHVY
jgi:hypothetical protein